MHKKSEQPSAGQTLIVALSARTYQKLDDLRRLFGKASPAEVAAEAIDWYVRFRSVSALELLGQLTPRLRQVLQLIGEGHTSKQIATKLGISIKTVEMHRTHLMKTLHIHGVADWCVSPSARGWWTSTIRLRLVGTRFRLVQAAN